MTGRDPFGGSALASTADRDDARVTASRGLAARGWAAGDPTATGFVTP